MRPRPIAALRHQLHIVRFQGRRRSCPTRPAHVAMPAFLGDVDDAADLESVDGARRHACRSGELGDGQLGEGSGRCQLRPSKVRVSCPPITQGAMRSISLARDMSYPYITLDNFVYREQRAPRFDVQLDRPRHRRGDLSYSRRPPIDAQERIRRYQASAQAENTSRAYGAQLRLFKAWCAGTAIRTRHRYRRPSWRGGSSSAPTPALSRSTLAVALAAVKFGHRIAGKASTPQTLTSCNARRRAAVRPSASSGKPPLSAHSPRRCAGDVRGPRPRPARRGNARDPVHAALRRSELVEIDLEKRGDGLAVLRLTDEGLELELLRSKNSQEKPVTVAVARSCNPRGFAALERWIAHAGIQPGTPLFRRIHPRGGIGGRITADGPTGPSRRR